MILKRTLFAIFTASVAFKLLNIVLYAHHDYVTLVIRVMSGLTMIPLVKGYFDLIMDNADRT